MIFEIDVWRTARQEGSLKFTVQPEPPVDSLSGFLDEFRAAIWDELAADGVEFLDEGLTDFSFFSSGQQYRVTCEDSYLLGGEGGDDVDDWGVGELIWHGGNTEAENAETEKSLIAEGAGEVEKAGVL